jgi:hypothetical protein
VPGVDWDAVGNRSGARKIHRLGNVNLDAIGEMDELEQRSTFLSNRVTDLTTSSSSSNSSSPINTEARSASSRRSRPSASISRHVPQALRRRKSRRVFKTEVEKQGPDRGRWTAYQTVLQIRSVEAGIEAAKPPGKQPVSVSNCPVARRR